ncbi:hypothetical protein C922_04908 [Plasmodium inui San Antonio 1]|uniref:Uncharacterized protein n=1 Tax=Plasmodium inui San Antonio 1 TaxID=1237626 RepID=W7A6N2_9APIC|nr:hypothetical protein C922_04908 [Plasmodium inui San Antonio 1]EUD64764.1 hypothetical protein C922_04908 [Plasmodium inui San Antonio 1]
MPHREKASMPRNNSTHHSDLTHRLRNDSHKEHHRDTGEKSIIMKKRHKKNRDRNAADKRIFIKMPGEVVSS